MISVHFSNKAVNNFADAAAADNARFNRFFHAMLDKGIYLPPSAYETWFVSNALSPDDVVDTLNAAEESIKGL